MDSTTGTSTGKNKKGKGNKKKEGGKAKGGKSKRASSPALNGNGPGEDAADEVDDAVSVAGTEGETTKDAPAEPVNSVEGSNQDSKLTLENHRTDAADTASASGETESPGDGEPYKIKRLEGMLAELRKAVQEEKDARVREKAEADDRLSTVQQEKEDINEQYHVLLARLSGIKSTLGQRLKDDAEELAQSRRTVEELEDQMRVQSDTIEELHQDLDKLTTENQNTSRELSTLRNRFNLAQQNWVNEREDLGRVTQEIQEECEHARQERQDWEVIAVEERAVRESLGDRVIELEEQLQSQVAANRQVASERERSANMIDGLQRALQEIQEARRKDLKETVESMQAQIDKLTTKSEELDKQAKDATAQLAAAKQELERALPFEKDAKEKNLLIGKLRHEAVTLNDHLRKALRLVKRDNAEDKIDKQLITNVMLQFVSIQRGDQKKYEVLQLIASVLEWNDEQREKAGLLRPGTASASHGSSLKTPPMSPFYRSPSNASLTDAYDGSKELWSSVLDSQK